MLCKIIMVLHIAKPESHVAACDVSLFSQGPLLFLWQKEITFL